MALDRRTVVKGGLAAGALWAAGCTDGDGGGASGAAGPGEGGGGTTTTSVGAGLPGAIDGRPNLVVIFTDQQRTPQHWPAGWAQENEPSMDRLQRTGLTFTNQFVAATQCTPSRSTILTGTYPWVNGVTETFSTWVTTPLQSAQMTIARLLSAAGYDVAWKGKWHLSESVQGSDTVWTEHDIENLSERYGVPGWNPPDAGNSLQVVSTAGGGTPNNDGRIVSGVDPTSPGQTQGWGESALDYLERARDLDRPFALFVSLVNPHDIGFYPSNVGEVGYDPAEFADEGISLPDNYDDDLSTKPSVQSAFMQVITESAAPIDNDEQRLQYVNLYAYLHRVVDPHVTAVLDALDELGLTESTIVVRAADHGEQAMSHRMIEKMYQCYDETMRVPLVVSNPVLFPEPVETAAFASLIDLVPTLADLARVDPGDLDGLGLAGTSLAPVIADPTAHVRDDVLFTYDDLYGARVAGFEHEGKPSPLIDPSLPGHIRCVRERDWKYAVYFTEDGSALQYELYDLVNDPLELRNLAWEPTTEPALDAERQRLHRLLTERLGQTGTLPLGFTWPTTSGPSSA